MLTAAAAAASARRCARVGRRVDDARSSGPEPAVGVTFSPGGLAFPYLLGAASGLSRRGVITASTPLAGSSAGGIVAVVMALDIPVQRTLEAALRINDGCRRGGARGRLLNLLEEECKDLIPEDAVEVLARRPAAVRLAVCRLFHTTHLFPRGLLLSTFEDRRGLVEAILASSCIPFYAASTPCCGLGGWPAVDGFFGIARERFGCPPTGAARELAVAPFNYDAAAVGRVVPAGFHDPAGSRSDLICPGLHTSPELSTQELLRVALAQPPATDRVLLGLFEQGERDAEAWWCRGQAAAVSQTARPL